MEPFNIYKVAVEVRRYALQRFTPEKVNELYWGLADGYQPKDIRIYGVNHDRFEDTLAFNAPIKADRELYLQKLNKQKNGNKD